LEKLDELKLYVEKLWYSGFFFNYWVSSVNKFLNLKSFPVLITDEIILQGKDSIFDGNLTLEYLKKAFENL